MSEDTEIQNEVDRRRFLQTGAAAAAAGIAGCMGEDKDENWNKPEKTPLPLDTDTPTETQTDTETPEPEFSPLSYEQIIENTYIPEDKWQLDPIITEGYKKNFEDTSVLITETIRRARENERVDPNQTLSLHEMMPHNRTYIHGKEHLDFTYDDITIARRLSQAGQEVMRVWDNTGTEELQYIIDPSGYDKEYRDTMILRENEEHDKNSSVQRALNAYRHGDPSMNPLGVEQMRDQQLNPEEHGMSVEEALEGAEDRARGENDNIQEILEYTETPLPNGETVDVSQVNITFDWDIGNHVLDLSKDREFFTQGTEYIHNVAVFTDTQNVLFGFQSDIQNLSDSQLGQLDNQYEDVLPADLDIIQEVGKVADESVQAAPVTQNVYDEAVEDLYKPEELLEKAS